MELEELMEGRTPCALMNNAPPAIHPLTGNAQAGKPHSIDRNGLRPTLPPRRPLFISLSQSCTERHFINRML